MIVPGSVPFLGGGILAASTAKSLLHFDGVNGAQSTIDQYGNSTFTWATAALDTATKKFGSASLGLGGNNSELLKLSSLNNSLTAFTLEWWIKFSTDTSNRGIISFCPTADTHGFELYSNSTTADLIVLLSSNGSSFDKSAGSQSFAAIKDNAWHHLACTLDNVASKFYIYSDGVKQLEFAMATTTSAWTRLQFGADLVGSATKAITGNIDEFRLTNSCVYPAGTTFTPPTGPFKR